VDKALRPTSRCYLGNKRNVSTIPSMSTCDVRQLPVPSSTDVVLRGTASPRGRIVTASASVSTNLPRSCYCLEAPIPEKPILLLQLIAFIKVTRKYEQNRRKIPLGLCPKATNRSCITCKHRVCLVRLGARVMSLISASNRPAIV